MSEIAWPELMRLGLVTLGLTPDQFWVLTPAELMFMAGAQMPAPMLTRQGLAALAARYPDKTTDRNDDGRD